MTYRRNYFLLASCLVILAMANLTAQEPQSRSPQQSSSPEKYLAKIMAALGPRLGTPQNLYVEIYHYTAAEELQKYEQILNAKNSQKTLLEDLHTHSNIGKFQVDNRFGAFLKLITEEPTKKGRRVFMVGDRFDVPPSGFSQRDPRDYPFTVIKFDLDADGNGGGTLTYAAQLRFNKKHGIEVQDSTSQPVVLITVQKDAK